MTPAETHGHRRGLRAAVFLDRDDTLIVNRALGNRLEHPTYLYQPELVELLPGTAEGCAMLTRSGYVLVLITNQSSVARGWCEPRDVERTNQRVRELLEHAGARLEGAYTCFHSPDGVVPGYAVDHPWRKPRGGMIRAAAEDLQLDLSRSWMVGDVQRDIDAGLDAGIALERTVLVGQMGERCGWRASDILEMARHVMESTPRAARQ